MTVDDFYQLLNFAVAKNNGQGYLSPSEFNILVQKGESSYLTFLVGEYQKYIPGRPVPVVQFGQNERIQTSMAPLLYSTVLPINAQGIANYPSDFEQVNAMQTMYGSIYSDIRFVTADKRVGVRNSVIDPIATNPIYSLASQGFQFYPVNLGLARMDYVRTVPYMRWGWITDSNGIEVYNPASSVQPIWSDLDLWDIAVRCLDLLGVRLQSQTVQQYAAMIKNGGQ